MTDPRDPHSLAVHAGAGRAPDRPLSVPIVQASTFALPSTARGAELSTAVAPPRFYTRWGNPTIRALEVALAELEGAEAALAFGSGMAAMSTAVIASVAAGDHVLCSRHIYGGVVQLVRDLLPRFGVEGELVDVRDPEALTAHIRPTTRLLLLESPANPTVDVVDLKALCAIARRHGVCTLVDNTWATPWNQRPLALGADGVVHSVTKALGGHSDVIAGAVIGPRAWVDAVWRTQKVLGGCISPHDAWLVIRGIKTLGVRQERACATALELARWLRAHPAVRRVHYPGLAEHPGHAVARAQMRSFGSMLAFEVASREAAAAVAEGVRLITHAVSLGGVESLICHPASTTHSPLDDAELAAAGIAPGLLRMSVGLEGVDDLAEDLDRALGTPSR